MHAFTLVSQNSWSPLAFLADLDFHAAADGLGDTELAAQHVHLERVLGRAPVVEAGFQWV